MADEKYIFSWDGAGETIRRLDINEIPGDKTVTTEYRGTVTTPYIFWFQGDVVATVPPTTLENYTIIDYRK
jgi:hypothetical protein